MKLSLSLALFATCLTASAAIIRRQGPSQCCFTLVAMGPPNGTVEEDNIGENRIGGIFQQGTYCISDAVLTDVLGHRCVIAPKTGQFLCEDSRIPSNSSFTIAQNGNLLHDGCQNFYACPSNGPGNDGSYNIFSDKITTTPGCLSITILTGGFSCAVLGRPSSTDATSVPTTTAQPLASTPPSSSISNAVPVTPFTDASAPTATSTATPTSTLKPTSEASCPTDISTVPYLAPNLIIPVSPDSPDTAFGTQYNATITPQNITTFTFDIPPTWVGNCALLFLFPYGNKASFPYLFTGIEEEETHHGGLDFAFLSSAVNETTTFNTLPGVDYDFGVLEIFPGSSYVVGVGECNSGERITFSASSVGGVGLQYFQSTGNSPIGVFAVQCS